MVVAAVVGDKVVGLNSDVPEAYVVQFEDRYNLNLIVAGAWTRPGADDAIPFQPIGLGKPLTVILETMYVGDYPDTLRFIPGAQKGDILVTSSHKPFQNFDGAPRAVHLLEEKSERREFLQATASAGGSQLLYYSPAVTDTSVLFTVEVSADREFSDELADGLSQALSSAAALPVFAPAAPYLVSAGAAVKIGKKAADMLARPRPYYCETLDVNFGLAGRAASVACALLLWPGDDAAEVEGYTVDKDFRLRTPEGEIYKGDRPYAVLSLDGTKHEDLEGWTARAMSAVMLERFFEPKEAMQETLDLATESLSLFNDMSYQKRARDAAEAAKTAEGAEKERLDKLVAAYSKNIQNADIRKTVEPAAAD